MGKDRLLCMCRFILHICQCCDSHEDNGFAFHWSGQDGHQKITNVLPLQLGVGAAWGLKGLVARGTDGQPTMLSFIWMDWECCYFVASASSLDSGIPYSHNKCLWSWMHCLRMWNSPSHSPRRWKSITKHAV